MYASIEAHSQDSIFECAGIEALSNNSVEAQWRTAALLANECASIEAH